MKTTTDNFKFPARNRALTEKERKEAFEAGRETAMDCWFGMYYSGDNLEKLVASVKSEGWSEALIDAFGRKDRLRITGCAPYSNAEHEWLTQYTKGADAEWMNILSAHLGEG